MKNDNKRMGQLIKEARKARGMTQMELSELIECRINRCRSMRRAAITSAWKD